MAIRPNGINGRLQQAMIEMEKIKAARKIVAEQEAYDSVSEVDQPKQTSATSYAENSFYFPWCEDHPLNEKITEILLGASSVGYLTAKAKRLAEARRKYAGKHNEVTEARHRDFLHDLAMSWQRKASMGKMSKGDCVYIVQGLPGVFKIGKAKDLASRVSALQVGSPVPLTLIGCIVTGNQKYVVEKLEGMLHQHYQSKRVHGEWFRLNKGEIGDLFHSSDRYLVFFNEPSFENDD